MSDAEYRAEQIAVVAREMARLDLVNVVRCRDCAYINHREYNNGLEYQTCSYFDSEYAEVEPDGFCAWSCRRSDKE